MKSLDLDSVLNINLRGKRVVLIDFSHLCYRNLFTSHIEAMKTPSYMLNSINSSEIYFDVIPEDPLRGAAIQDVFYHFMIKSLLSIKKQFNAKPEEIYICVDSSSWRKKEYAGYKAGRGKSRSKSPFEWSAVYKMFDKLKTIIGETTKINIFESNTAEADDVIFVLSRELSKLGFEIDVVTADKDIKQVLRFDNVKMWDPIKKEYIENYDTKMLLHHILIGDSSDDIPSIKAETEFDPKFLTYLKSNNIFLTDVKSVKKLEIFDKMLEEYEGVVYKQARFGDKTALKVLENKSLMSTIRENSLYRDNFRRNRKLIDMRKIPKNIQENIINEYSNIEEKTNDMFTLQSFFTAHRLKDGLKHMSSLLM